MAGEQSNSRYNRAAGPIQNQTVISTPATGLKARYVEIPARDRHVSGYYAYPEGRSNSPAVVVLSEAFGLHEHIADIVRRFAREGFFAIAPDLMVRQGDPSTFEDVQSLVQELLLRIPDEQVMADLDSTLDWLQTQGTDIDKAGVTGFCWGGRWAWLYAARRKLQSAVAWYGILDGKHSGIFRDQLDRYPLHPADVVTELKTPVLGLYGGNDEAIPLATIQNMQTALKSGSPTARRSRIHVYPKAGHAFFADYRATYQHAAATDAWARCVEWLHTSNLREPVPL